MSTSETPGGSAIPAGWYDDPSGAGLRWWDGEQWTEHVHTPESAAAAGGASPGGSREGKPPRELVKLRERIRARGIKGVGIVLGGIVVVIVVIALLVSGGGESSNANPTPGAGNAPTKAATGKQAQIKKIDKQLQNKNLSKQKRKQLEAQKKKLEKGSGKSKAKGGGKKKVSPGEEGN